MKSRWKALKDRDKSDQLFETKDLPLSPDQKRVSFIQSLQTNPESIPQILEVPQISNKVEPPNQTVNNYYYCLPFCLTGKDLSTLQPSQIMQSCFLPGNPTEGAGTSKLSSQFFQFHPFCAVPPQQSIDQSTQTEDSTLSHTNDEGSLTRNSSEVKKATESSQSESNNKDVQQKHKVGLQKEVDNQSDSSVCSVFKEDLSKKAEMIPSLSVLYQLVQELFLEDRMTRSLYSTLPLFEKRVLYYLVKRKFSVKFQEGFELDEITCEWPQVLKLSQMKSIRRPEECYKFVLTRVLKSLRKRTEQAKKEHITEATFYQLHFGEVAAKLGVPVSDFYFPLSGTNKGKAHFNLSYFSKIFQSKSFVKEVEKYCRFQIFEDFKADFDKKVQAMVRRWNKLLLEQQEFVQYAQQSILKYIIYNRRCKLPWTRNEVEQAVSRIKQLMLTCPQNSDV